MSPYPVIAVFAILLVGGHAVVHGAAKVGHKIVHVFHHPKPKP